MGRIGSMLNAVRTKEPQSKLIVSAHYGPDFAAVEGPDSDSAHKYDMEDYERCKKSVAGIKKVLDEWIPEDVAARAKKSLEEDLERQEMRMEELKIRIKAHKASKRKDEDEDSEEE